MRDAGGHFSQRGQILFPAHLFLELVKLGQIAHQAKRAAHFHVREGRNGGVRVSARGISYRAVDGRNGHTQVADFTIGGHVLYFAALKSFGVAQAGRKHFGEI